MTDQAARARALAARSLAPAAAAVLLTLHKTPDFLSTRLHFAFSFVLPRGGGNTHTPLLARPRVTRGGRHARKPDALRHRLMINAKHSSRLCLLALPVCGENITMARASVLLLFIAVVGECGGLAPAEGRPA